MTFTNIPDSVSNDDLQRAMAQAQAPAEVLFNGKTTVEVIHTVMRHSIDKEFDNPFLINKIEAICAIRKLRQRHASVIEELKQTGQPGQLSAWQLDADNLETAEMLLASVQCDDNDPLLVSLREEARDSYLSTISDDSLNVLEHFGAEAPGLLNQYSCALEDALLEQMRANKELRIELAKSKGCYAQDLRDEKADDAVIKARNTRPIPSKTESN